MSWELLCDVECPHCDWENDYVTIAFNEEEFGPDGGNSHLMSQQCTECDKVFWFRGRVSFEVDVDDVWKKKPKEQK